MNTNDFFAGCYDQAALKTRFRDSATHTPGPWKLVPIYAQAGELTHAVTDESGHACITYALPRTLAAAELMANAQLIAAAPDLLAAAIAALSIIQIERPDGSICADLISAIRKATQTK